MRQIIQVKPSSLLAMEPETLAEFLRNEVELDTPESIDTPEGRAAAARAMQKATAYICYFREMEALAKARKRKRKRDGCTPEEADNLLGCEEIFEAYKKIAEQHFDQVAKMMTLKRLMLDEVKLLGTGT